MDESHPPVAKRKRAKISYSCIVCRDKKTKCDKNSICGACKDRGTTCQYDATTQARPKKPNKDALILRLSKQLEYYKDLACKYTPKNKLFLFNDDIHAIDYALGARTLKNDTVKKKIKKLSPTDKNDEDHYILPLKRNDDNYLYDVFSDIYIFKADDYVNTMFFKKSNNKSLINSKKDDKTIINNLLNTQTFKSDFQKSQALKFTQILLAENSSNENKESINPFTGIFNTFNFDNVVENTIENIIDGEPSNILKNIIITVNQSLPSRSSINHYKKVYFEKLYPEYPYFDVDYLEDTLLEVLCYNSEVVTLNLGKDNIRNKICMVALLFLVLYLAMFNENINTDADAFSNDEFISIAMKLLLTTDFFSNPNEYQFSVLCQIWVCLAISPDSEYSEDITKKAPTASLVGVIAAAANDLKIGYDTDIDERTHLVSDELRVLRKKLSSAFTNITLCQDIFTHGVRDIKSFQNLKYSTDVKGLGSNCEFENQIYKYSLLRNHQYKLIYEMMLMFRKKQPEDENGEFLEEVDVVELNKKIELLFEFVDTAFPRSAMQKLSKDDEYYLYPNKAKHYSLNKTYLKNLVALNYWVTARAIILRVYHVVLVSSEYLSFNSFNKVANKWFMYYIKKTLYQSIELLILLRRVQDSEYIEYLPAFGSLYQEYVLLYTYSKTFIVLLQFIGKCFVFKMHLQMMVQNENADSTKLKVEKLLVEEMYDASSKILFKALQEYSHLYRFKRYKCFKVCLFFDFFKQIFTDDTLFNTMFETDIKYNPDSPLAREVCNNGMMRHYLKFYDYLDDFKSMTEYFRSPEVQEYLKKKPFKQKASNKSKSCRSTIKKMPQEHQQFERPMLMNYQRPQEYPVQFNAHQTFINNSSKLVNPVYPNLMNTNTQSITNIPNFGSNNMYVSAVDPNYYQPYQSAGVMGHSNRPSVSNFQFNNMPQNQVNVINNPQMGPNMFMNNPQVNGRNSQASPSAYSVDEVGSNSNLVSNATFSGTDSDTANDDFTFEDYLRQLDLQKFDLFGAAFLF